jgi:hypothetical protein
VCFLRGTNWMVKHDVCVNLVNFGLWRLAKVIIAKQFLIKLNERMVLDGISNVVTCGAGSLNFSTCPRIGTFKTHLSNLCAKR